MKNLILILLLLSFTFNYANADNSKKGSKGLSKKESKSVNGNKDLKAFDFTADTIFKNVTFNAIDEIDYINIYDANQQQIFSASARIIVGDTLNISFLEKGTYYIEVIIGENIGAKQIII